MRICLLCLLFISSAVNSKSQDLASDSLKFNPMIDSIAEKLVSMAMINPRISTIENTTDAADYDVRRSRTAWLNNIAVAGNLNEISLRQGGTVDPLIQSTQYPRYNIGVVMPLGLFINNGKTTKSNYYKYEALNDQIRIEKQNIRKEVLNLYNDYLLNKQLLAIRQTILQDSKILLSRHEEKFVNGEITLELYTITSKQYNTDKTAVLSMIHEFKQTVTDLEALIGMNIEIALDQIHRESGTRN